MNSQTHKLFFKYFHFPIYSQFAGNFPKKNSDHINKDFFAAAFAYYVTEDITLAINDKKDNQSERLLLSNTR